MLFKIVVVTNYTKKSIDKFQIEQMDLQATVEFAIELHKFYNIDLFQRGLYQLKCYLKVLPKILPVQFETTIGEDSFPGQNYGTSRIFQILYRNEEILLRDIIMFRVHLLVDSRHLKESIERAEFLLTIEVSIEFVFFNTYKRL